MVFNEVMEKYERIIADATEARDAKIIPIDIPTVVLTARDLPAGMPWTNRLDKMTKEQAIWAIRNGDAWIAYLKTKEGTPY